MSNIKETEITRRAFIKNGVRGLAAIFLGAMLEKTSKAEGPYKIFLPLVFRNSIELPSSPQRILDYWSDEVYRIYKDTDLQGVIDGITQRGHLSAGAASGIGINLNPI